MHWNYNTLRSILKLASVCAVMAVATEAPAHLAPIWGTVLDEYNRQIGWNVSCITFEVSYGPRNTHSEVSNDQWTSAFAGIDGYNRQIARNVSCIASQMVSFSSEQLAGPDQWTSLSTDIDEYNRQIGHIVFCTAAQVSVPSGHVAVSALGGPLFAGIDKYNTQIARTVPCTAPYLIAIRLPQGIADSFASEPVLKEKATSPF